MGKVFISEYIKEQTDYLKGKGFKYYPETDEWKIKGVKIKHTFLLKGDLQTLKKFTEDLELCK